jgi:glycosyltransferase involved in cell wall biosynthesis
MSPARSATAGTETRARIKVLFVQTSLPGGDRSLYNILRNLDPDEFQTTLFLLKPECVNADELAGSTQLLVGSKRIGRLRRHLASIFGRLVRVVAAHDIVVGSLELDSTYLVYLATRVHPRPVVGWVRIALKEYLKLKQSWHVPLVRMVYPRLDRVVFNAIDAAASTQDIVSLKASRVAVIPSSLDPAAIDLVERTGPSWEYKPSGDPLVMAICRLNPEKGLDVLIRAHRRLRDVGVQHSLAILGKGPLRDELAGLANQLHVADTVMMPGYFANPFSAMKKATVFVLASRVEGCPSVLLEALHLGVPIVATSCLSGPSEILDCGRYGLLVPPNNEVALAEAIGQLLNDPAQRMQLSAAGQVRVQEYSAATIAARWEKLLTQTLQEWRGSGTATG